MSYFSQELTRDKLIVLYFFETTNFALTCDQFMTIALDNGWDDYFSLQAAINDLADSLMLAQLTRPQGVCFCISEYGRHTLAQFVNRLPESLRKSIDEYARKNRISIMQQSQHVASVREIDKGQFMVDCMIMEGEMEIFCLSVNVVSKEIASTVAARWQGKAGELYNYVLSQLCHEPKIK